MLTKNKSLKYFLFFGLLVLFSTVACAVSALEARYPPIAGQAITAASKLPDFALYLFNAGMFVGFFSVFLSLIIAGAMFALSPVSAELRAGAKDRVSGALSGLLILVLTYLIITTINPQLAFFKTGELPEAPPIPEEKGASGVYFYEKSSECPANPNKITPYSSSISDLGPSKNKINTVNIAHNEENEVYYVSILYENPGLWGKCQYIDPNSSCIAVEPFASSASVYVYDFEPNGDGVYFYRKSYFDESGGCYKVPNKEIIDRDGLYIEELKNLRFSGRGNNACSTPIKEVPLEERDCTKFDKNGVCEQRESPTLAGENISSVRINGDYIVLFSYAEPGETCESVINKSCQEFPTVEDINKEGPQQMKWQNIRNNEGVIPNCVAIIPIQR